jgi:hypothetical protein
MQKRPRIVGAMRGRLLPEKRDARSIDVIHTPGRHEANRPGADLFHLDRGEPPMKRNITDHG